MERNYMSLKDTPTVTSTNLYCTIMKGAFGYHNNTKESLTDEKTLIVFYVLILRGKRGKFYELSKKGCQEGGRIMKKDELLVLRN